MSNAAERGQALSNLLSNKQLHSAKAKDILAVAEGLGMKLIPERGNVYHWEEHDSLKLYPDRNTFRWWSQETGGDTIHLVQVIQELNTGKRPNFKEAVNYLITGEFETIEVEPLPEREPFNYYLKRFESKNFDLGRDYLKNERGLSDETIDLFLKAGVLAQANHKTGDLIEPVIVFKSLDVDGSLKGATLQGIENHPDIHERGHLKKIMTHSDGMMGLTLDIGQPKRLVFAEAPIDLMSYYEVHKESLKDVRLVAMDGLKKATVSRYVADMASSDPIGPNRPSQVLKDNRRELGQLIDRLHMLDNVSQRLEDGLITLAVDNDEAGRKFIKEKFQDMNIPVKVDIPPLADGQKKNDWNDYLKAEKGLIKLDKKAPEKAQEHTKKAENEFGDLPGNQEAAPLPEADEPQPLNESSPTQTQSQPLLHFTISEAPKSIYKVGYHPITASELNRLNNYVQHLQEAAKWYDETLADSKVTYFVKDEDEINSIEITFEKKQFMHLTGIYLVKQGITSSIALDNIIQGQGHYDNIYLANRNAAFSKLQIMPELKAIADSSSFYFNDVSDIKKFQRLDASKAIRTKGNELVLALRTDDGKTFPASLMKPGKTLNILMDETAEERAILGIYRKKGGKIDTLSVNERYISDGGKEMLEIMKNNDFSLVQSESQGIKRKQSLATLDSDGDGLSDEVEIARGTNPYSPDSDGDGVPDGQEVAEGTDPLNASDNSYTKQQRDMTVTNMIKNNDIKALNEHLKEGIKSYFNSDNYKEFLNGMADFNNYSPRNIQLIKAQLPQATLVASFNQWKKRGGSVKGQKAIYIQAPVKVTIKDIYGNPKIDPKTGEELKRIIFRSVPVFDVSQVTPQEGKTLDIPSMSGDATTPLSKEDYNNMYRSLKEISQSNGVPIRFDQTEPGVGGFYDTKRNEIVISNQAKRQPAQVIGTLIHEMAHSELHNDKTIAENYPDLKYSTGELQAESVAYVVSRHLGIDMGIERSFGYLASWAVAEGGLESLTAQLEIVQKESASLIERIDHAMTKYQKLSEDKVVSRDKVSMKENTFYDSLAQAKKRTSGKTTEEDEAPKKSQGIQM
ncbi:PBECR4 domain-containing protein [Streptococcus salivarius]|uniref:PBECR4 domain-containing protein n=1 Tax=Streptococcus salivarius TaxID=1304 RepID=UPI00321B7E65